MESRAFAFWTGLFVIGLTAGVLAWGNWLAQERVARTAYRVVATGPVTGLNPEAQVRYRGIPVGRVASIHLDPNDARRILIDIQVDANIPITRGTTAQLGLEGITGIAYVHLLDDGKDPTPLRRTGKGPAEIALRPSFFDSVSDSAEGAVRDTRTLLAGLNALLTPENRVHISNALASLERLTANLEATSARLPGTVTRAEAFFSAEKSRRIDESLEQLSAAAKDLPRVTREAQRLLHDARGVVGRFGELSAAAQSALGAAERETLPRANTAADSADRAAQRVGGLAQELQRRPESVIWGAPPRRPGPGEPGFE
jgi:phospholipid/cholesterol/gamma-HCH transport system substrate-binding protein